MLPCLLAADALVIRRVVCIGILCFFSGLLQMPKLKTHKGIKKRFKITAKGKLRHKHPGAGHLMNTKNAKRRRRLGTAAVLTGVYAERMKLALGK
jgi:large subunit ribosomal protein L35